MDLVYFIVILGDRAQALCKILQVKESKSEFLEEFMLEGLGFSSSMYLYLIWLHIFWYVLKNPKDVKKRLNPMLTSFGDFFNNPTRDNYVKGLLNDMSKLAITPKKQYTAKRKLSKLVDSDDSELKCHFFTILTQNFVILYRRVASKVNHLFLRNMLNHSTSLGLCYKNH